MSSWFAFASAELLPRLNEGLWMSVRLIVPSVAFGLLFGIVLGGARTYGAPWVRRITVV